MIAASEVVVSYPIAISVCSGIVALFVFVLRHAINTDKHLNGKRFVTEDKFDGMVNTNEQAHKYILGSLDEIKQEIKKLSDDVYKPR